MLFHQNILDESMHDILFFFIHPFCYYHSYRNSGSHRQFIIDAKYHWTNDFSKERANACRIHVSRYFQTYRTAYTYHQNLIFRGRNHYWFVREKNWKTHATRGGEEYSFIPYDSKRESCGRHSLYRCSRATRKTRVWKMTSSSKAP